MKRLGLFRHAKSEWDDMNLRDFDRGLNERGRRGAALMGRHMREYGAKWDLVIASAAERVRQTIAAADLSWPVEFTERAYLADTSTLFDLLRERGADNDAVLLAGHNPGLHDMVFEIASDSRPPELLEEAGLKLPTASFLVFELAIDDWNDIDRGCGTLVHFARPRDLDSELGPEH